MTPRQRALLLATLSLVSAVALAGCLSEDPVDEEEPPVQTAPPPPVNLTHNVTTYEGQITLQARGPTGNLPGASRNGVSNPIIATTNYTGMVVKLTWEASSAATESLKLHCRPEGGEPLTVSGPSPLRIPIDMTANATRSWFIDVTTDDDTTPASGGAAQPYTVIIGQYAGANGTFDPEWDPQP